ncbi:zinc ABC transporter substrate-binding protein [Marinobacter sp. SS8-8]|uniref:zinc ABC transporter substrate-binding protein n=1 Tax=Marinobacter sp. SS8-8 TaxID=3050452 RepID=UPI0026DF5FEC|nr:zinc ABC transporter substrate-binding protein [Marinobacter sp. SS8-8]|tara:strand:+ start:1787 stop:2704 length:918 start_codon:yes stop_codon:yes gene_type:complete
MRAPGNALSLALGASILLVSNILHAETRIVTSIKPVELIVRAIATEDMQTTSLVPAGSSPHNYTMKPSQRRALENADVIFWVGPEMENFLYRLLSGQEFSSRTVKLMTGEHESDNAGQSDQDAQGHNHGNGEDPHIWLDPELAIEMAETIRDALARLDSVNLPAMDQNFEQFQASVRETESAIRARLAPAHDISLFSYHSAFTRFADYYDLKLEGVLTLNPELSPGAHHIAEVQGKLRKGHHPCLLTEPQFNQQWWKSITQNLDVTFSTWDPLASEIKATANSYSDFQHSIADAVLKCLPENTQH